MATSETTNLQLVKYGAGTDNFIRTDYNGNLDKIDTFAGNTNEAIANLEKHTLGANVDLMGYTSTSNQYTCTADGYVAISTGSTLNDEIAVRINGNFTVSAFCTRTSYSNSNGMFVKKGMTLYTITNIGTNNTAVFKPLQ